MNSFMHDFMEVEGVPHVRNSKECMDYLQNTAGYSFLTARGIIGRAIAMGWITCITNTNNVKEYI